jgi:hypothetical protein
MVLAPKDEDWKRAVRASVMSAHEVLERHPWAAGLILSGPTVNMARLRWMDDLLGTFRRGGFSPELTENAYHVLDSHIMGFAMWLASVTAGMGRLTTSLDEFRASLDSAGYPWLAEHVEQHLKPADPGDPGTFAFGLDLILDGLERAAAAG